MSRSPSTTGLDPSRPIVIGVDNGEPAMRVVATGLVGGLRKGQERWVAGSGVYAELTAGTLVQLHGALYEPTEGLIGAHPVARPRAVPMETRLERAEDTIATLVIDVADMRTWINELSQLIEVLSAPVAPVGVFGPDGVIAVAAPSEPGGVDVAPLAGDSKALQAAARRAAAKVRAEEAAQARMMAAEGVGFAP